MTKKVNEKVDFDLSILSLEELIETYENIEDFESFLEDSKIETEEGEEDE